MPKYRVTRDYRSTLTVEIEADGPADAVLLAMGRDVKWEDAGDGGMALIDAVSESVPAGTNGKCWSVEWTDEFEDDEEGMMVLVEDEHMF